MHCKYLPVVPYKALENFSKALYGTTGRYLQCMHYPSCHDVKYLLQNRFAFFISLFGLSAILKIRNGEHAHYVGLVVTYTCNREKQMFVALGKKFDMFFNQNKRDVRAPRVPPLDPPLTFYMN